MLALDKLKFLSRPVRQNSTIGLWSPYDANMAGGALVGIGMALSGACPGTVLVQLAQGIPSAQGTAVGALLGATLYVKVRPLLVRAEPHASQPAACRKTISEALHVSETTLYPTMGLSIVAVLGLTTAGRERSLASPVVGGLLIGSAQAMSLLLTSSPLGVSATYEHLSLYILQAFGVKPAAVPSFPSRPVLFSLGIILGSTLLLMQNLHADYSATDVVIPAWQAFVGGTVMTFGARLGGGCTSGHGLSGVSAMSASSFVTVAAMFGAGILTRALI